MFTVAAKPEQMGHDELRPFIGARPRRSYRRTVPRGKNMKRNHIASLLAALGVCIAVLIGCHAKPDDPAGQAEE